jgi:molecular chaperone GrpE
MVSMLERNWGLKRFSAKGEPFDPEKHEAIAVEETDKHDSEIVLEDYQKGYLLHDRVLRPAKVKVARPVTSEQVGVDDEQNKES